ncbi:MAG: FAD-dependent oxidoreductase [Phycisphaerae bacterium]|nr:FAD-dependent oxidoreductase [Phycisphaerae bacterium]
MDNENTTFVTEPARQVRVVEDVDVVVIGGGPGGLPAAVAAARQGAKVLIVEHYGFPGGLASAGMIGPLFGYNAAQTDDLILGGIPLEIIRELQALDGAPQEKDIRWGAIPFEPEMMKHALERLAVREKSIRFLYHTHAVGVIRDGNRIDCVLVENKSGRAAVRGRIFIDATGDGDVACWAGCAYTKGRPADGAMQSMGTKFRIGGIRKQSRENEEKSTEIFREAIAGKTLPVYHPFAGEDSEFGTTLRQGERTPTVTRARGDGTNVRDLTRNEIKFRADTLKIIDFCQRYIPGCEKCYLMATPTQIGVRETRQITGSYVLVGDDCLKAARFDEGIARGSWYFDIHCPLGLSSPLTSICNRACKVTPECVMIKKYKDQLYDNYCLEDGTYYEIPYGCLTPQGVDNLLVSGRCISADYGAMSSLRVIGTCFSIAQAAGTAAGMCLSRSCSPGELSGTEVREALKSVGVPL